MILNIPKNKQLESQSSHKCITQAANMFLSICAMHSQENNFCILPSIISKHVSYRGSLRQCTLFLSHTTSFVISLALLIIFLTLLIFL